MLADPEREDTFYAVILADKQEFINAELTGAGHCTVHTACIDALPARLAESRERTLQEATVPSLRADAVLAASIFHYGEYTIAQAKERMRERGIPVRL